MRQLFIVLAAFAMGSAGLQAQTVNITTTAVPFLRISPDARGGGMADMGIGTNPGDANAVFHNLSKVSFASAGSGVSVNYTPWMRDVVDGVYLAAISGYHQLDEHQSVGVGLRYFNMGDYRVTDYSGNKLGSAHPREFSLDGGYTRKLSEAFGIGLAFRYIHSDLAGGSVNGMNYKAGNAAAADVSLYYHGMSGLSAGLVLSNLGTKIGYTDEATAKAFLPANVGVGLSYTIVVDEVNRLTFAGEGNHLLVPAAPADSAGLAEYVALSVPHSWSKSFDRGDYQGALGVEYEYDKLFSLRTGYHFGGQGYFTVGAGLAYQRARLDISYLAASGNGVTRNPLSNTVRLGVSFSLGKTK